MLDQFSVGPSVGNAHCFNCVLKADSRALMLSHTVVTCWSLMGQLILYTTNQPTNPPTHQPTNPNPPTQTHQPTNPPTHQPTNPPTNQLVVKDRGLDFAVALVDCATSQFHLGRFGDATDRNVLRTLVAQLQPSEVSRGVFWWWCFWVAEFLKERGKGVKKKGTAYSFCCK